MEGVDMELKGFEVILIKILMIIILLPMLICFALPVYLVLTEDDNKVDVSTLPHAMQIEFNSVKERF